MVELEERVYACVIRNMESLLLDTLKDMEEVTDSLSDVPLAMVKVVCGFCLKNRLVLPVTGAVARWYSRFLVDEPKKASHILATCENPALIKTIYLFSMRNNFALEMRGKAAEWLAQQPPNEPIVTSSSEASDSGDFVRSDEEDTSDSEAES